MSRKKQDLAGAKPEMKLAGNPAPANTAGVSPGVALIDEAKKALEAPWGRWYKAKGGRPKDGAEKLDDLLTVFDAYAKLTDTIPTTYIDAEYLGLALLRLGELNAPELLQFYVESVLAYLEFATDSGLWEGTEDEIQTLGEALNAMLEQPAHQGPTITVPELSIEDELASLKESSLLRQLAELVEWVGTGKDVTSSGVLRPREIEAAAAILGVKVRGNYPGAASEVGLHLVRSMNDVPDLANAWTLLVETGMLAVKSKHAIRSAAGKRWTRGTSEEQLAGYRKVATIFLMVWMEGTSEFGGLLNPISNLLVDVFVSAAQGEHYAVEQFPKPVGDYYLNAARNPGTENVVVNQHWGARAMPLLKELAEYGLLEIDRYFRIPPAFIRCYAEAFDKDFGIKVEYPQDDLLDLPSALEEEKPRTPGISKVYQLKITLLGSAPAVWRRILVPSELDFHKLHVVIQRVFGWEGRRGHGFRTAGRRGIEIGPYPEDPYVDGPDRNEEGTLLEEFFTRRKTKITYVYRSRADWTHEIILEDIVDPVKGRSLPQCISGGGAGPDGDCEGVWAWTELVAAVNDPRHPDHEERLEWLGMNDGELLDPNAFSLEDADAALKGLRRR